MAVFSAVSAGISAYQAGANVLQTVGISIVASIAGYYGATLGSVYGGWVGGGSFGSAVFAGMLGGAAGGATQAALTGGDVIRETLIGGGIGTASGIMIGGLSYNKPAQSQTSNSSQNNPAANEAIKSADPQGAIDAEVKNSNQPPVVARKVAGEKIAEAATKGSVGVGNNPGRSMPTPQEAREFYRTTVGPVGEMLMGIEAMATDLAGVFIKGVDWIMQGIEFIDASLRLDTGKGIFGHFDAYLRNPANKPMLIRDLEAGTDWNPWHWDPYH